MQDVNTLTVSELIELIRKEQQDQADRDAAIMACEAKILKLNSDIYSINERSISYRTHGSKYLAALREEVTPTN